MTNPFSDDEKQLEDDRKIRLENADLRAAFVKLRDAVNRILIAVEVGTNIAIVCTCWKFMGMKMAGVIAGLLLTVYAVRAGRDEVKDIGPK